MTKPRGQVIKDSVRAQCGPVPVTQINMSRSSPLRLCVGTPFTKITDGVLMVFQEGPDVTRISRSDHLQLGAMKNVGLCIDLRRLADASALRMDAVFSVSAATAECLNPKKRTCALQMCTAVEVRAHCAFQHLCTRTHRCTFQRFQQGLCIAEVSLRGNTSRVLDYLWWAILGRQGRIGGYFCVRFQGCVLVCVSRCELWCVMVACDTMTDSPSLHDKRHLACCWGCGCEADWRQTESTHARLGRV